MAATINRFSVSKYASLEVNSAGFRKTGEGVYQTPLATTFTAASPCENGMWVNANKAAGEIDVVSSSTLVFGIVYSGEKEYDAPNAVGLKNFCMKAGDYPRVGIMHVGDTFTSNCFCYDTAEFVNEAAVKTALAAIGTTPLYLVPLATSGAPKLTATAPASGAGFYAQVVKYYTVPNGELGIKYVVIVEHGVVA